MKQVLCVALILGCGLMVHAQCMSESEAMAEVELEMRGSGYSPEEFSERLEEYIRDNGCSHDSGSWSSGEDESYGGVYETEVF